VDNLPAALRLPEITNIISLLTLTVVIIIANLMNISKKCIPLSSEVLSDMHCVY